MNDIAANAHSDPPSTIFEQKLFERSPVGTLATTIGIFLALMGSFEILALATHYSLAEQLTLDPHEGTWPAFILSLIIAVGLGLQRYSHIKDWRDDAALLRVLPDDLGEFKALSPAALATLRRATVTGALVGAALTFVTVPAGLRHDNIVVFAWFFVVMGFLGTMFARGAVQTRLSSRNFRRRIDAYMKIDLLRIDELAIIGSSSARAALIWLSVAAIICLFFVSGDTPALVIAIILFSAAMALWIFFGSLVTVHKKIVAAKKLELDRVRHEIAALRMQAAHDHTAAVRLHGLIAYEKRIEDAHEWPFDQLTLLRVGAYALIPAAPAIGQALLKYFAEHTLQ